MNNGRVSFQDRPSISGSAAALPGFDYRKTTVQSEADDAVRGNWEATPLNRTYFSPANVQIVQNKVRREVYDRSNGEFLVDPQSADDLMIVMRAMYLQYGKNQPTNIPEQIAELNQMVADWCVPKVIAEASMHKTYLRDIQQLPVPLAHPVKMTMSGTKSATLDRFL